MVLVLTFSDFSSPTDGVNAIFFSFRNLDFLFILYCGHTALMRTPIKLVLKAILNFLYKFVKIDPN